LRTPLIVAIAVIALRSCPGDLRHDHARQHSLGESMNRGNSRAPSDF
jgi:hypothetical protein